LNLDISDLFATKCRLFHNLRFTRYKRLLSNTHNDLKGCREENSVSGARR